MEEKSMEQKGFDFSLFISEWKETLVNPKGYFSTMKTEGGLAEPVIKALIYGAVAGLLYLIWGLLHFGGGRYGYFGGMVGVGGLFGAVIGAVIGVFIGGVIVLIIAAITEGNKEFEACLRVSASLMALFPINAALSFLVGINAELSTIINLCINIYGLYLLYLGVTIALKGNEKTTKIIAFVLGGILLLLIIVGLITALAVRSFSGFTENKADEMIKNYQGLAQEAAADFEKAANELSRTSNFDKPENYPTEAIKQVEKSFATGQPKIMSETIEQLIAATEAIRDLEQAEIPEALEQNGFITEKSYKSAYVAVLSGMTALQGLDAMQKIIDTSDQEQATAFTFDQATLSLATQSITASKLTEEDLRNIYDNWDRAIELKNLSIK
ncbi:Yip1 family protein [Williamwhitmania taraxaci]|uniref:Yip1 domain-containing protein n=1 Tax=Williamwhitmania taraxaci TaxID=1640674 RepID=A0A1G6MI44_9BACT|nr:Yip1 family protein [Williamwhitmania taraxaci]SDC54907.1 hypothetical protein SAMN05216323_103610 [Williamwhitmania taraxaci]